MAGASLPPKSDRPTIIYGLVDPRTKDIRYVGKTVGKLGARLSGHLLDKEVNHRTRWVRILLNEGLRPEIITLEIVPPSQDWIQVEQRWIRYYRDGGARLTNTTNGGEGFPGRKLTPLDKEKLTEARNKSERFKVHLAQFSRYWQGRQMSEESKRKRSAAMKGRPGVKGRTPWNKYKEMSPEYKQTMSRAHKGRAPWNKGRPCSAEERQRIAHKLLGRRHSEEAKSRMSVAQKGSRNGLAKLDETKVEAIKRMIR
ncbi:MAG: NUMOD3 domain-containing DNA-binding protein, partial [Gammaproteobacteria bacterium]